MKKFAYPTEFNKFGEEETLLWLLLKDGSVIYAPASQVHSHPGLIYQKFGSDPQYQDLYSPDSPYAAMGEIRNNQIHLSSLLPPQVGEAPSQWEVVKAGRMVRMGLKQQGLSDLPQTMTATIPGKGDVDLPLYWGEKMRQVQSPEMTATSSLRGTFYDEQTGEEVDFHEVSHYGSDHEVGAEEYWEIQGSDGNTYFVTGDGDVRNLDDSIVGHFSIYAKTAAIKETTLPPSGLHAGSANALMQAGLTATYHLPPTQAHPEGYSLEMPHGFGKYMNEWMFPYWDETGGPQDMSHIPVKLEADDPEAVEAAVMSAERGQRRGNTEGPIKCPECGSHSYRAIHVDSDSKATCHCLTCGKEWDTEVTKNKSDHKSNFELYSNQYIKKQGDQWVITQKGTGKVLSHHASQEEAEAAFRAMMANKHGGSQHNPGTRVEIVHPSYRGQRGSVLKHNGKDSGVDEEKYDILLDNGEKAEGLRESDFKRIKSAKFNSDNHFLDSLPILASENDYGYKLADDDSDAVSDVSAPSNSDSNTDSEHSDTGDCPHCGSDNHDEIDDDGLHRCNSCGWVYYIDSEGHHKKKKKHHEKEAGTGGIEFPPCEGCGKAAGYKTYPFAHGMLECNNCGNLEPVKNVADRYNKMLADHERGIDQYSDGDLDAPSNFTLNDMGIPPEGESYYRGSSSIVSAPMPGQVPGTGFAQPGVQQVAPPGAQQGDPSASPCPNCGSTNVMSLSTNPQTGTPWMRCNACGTTFEGKVPMQQTPTQPPITSAENGKLPVPVHMLDDLYVADKGRNQQQTGLPPTDHVIPYVCPNCGMSQDPDQAQDPNVHGAPSLLTCPNCGAMWDDNSSLYDNHGISDLDDDVNDTYSSKKAAWSDIHGDPVSSGSWYVMKSRNWKVPDVIQVLNIEENRIEASIEGDIHGTFPLHIDHSDIDKNGYSFEPYKHEIVGLPAPESAFGDYEMPSDHPDSVSQPQDFNRVPSDPNQRAQQLSSQVSDLLSQGATEAEINAVVKQFFAIQDGLQDQAEQMQQDRQPPAPGTFGSWRLARKNFSPVQQRDLINENMSGRARNYDKLDLTNTHYETQSTEDENLEFLWM